MSSSKAKKVMIIGLDGCIAPTIKKLVDKGQLPSMARVFSEGCYLPDCLVPFPTITPPNWASISTGAWPGTHGVTDFNLHNPGDALHQIFPGFSSTECSSEFIWDAIAKAGKKTIIFNYPTGWPCMPPEGIILGNLGCSLNEERTYFGEEGEITRQIGYADDMLYTTESAPKASRIDLKEADGWKGDVEKGDREAELKVVFRRPKYGMGDTVWQLLVKKDRVLLCQKKDTNTELAELRPGKFSPVIRCDFDVDGAMKPAVFRAKLTKLEGKDTVSIYFTGIAALDEWARPNEVISEFDSKEGLPTSRGGYEAYLLNWIDPETLIQCIEFEHLYYGDVIPHLLTNKSWDLFIMHAHAPDWLYHTVDGDIDSITGVDSEDVAIAQHLEQEMYRSLDRLVGKISACADEETVIILTSDHGCKVTGYKFEVNKILEDAGLLAWGETDQYGHPVPDWPKTKAYGQRSIYIYINLKGRDPHGIVAQGKEYEALRRQIINALYDYTDPKTGIKPIALALKKEDALILGLKGERIGDIVYAVNPEFGKEHGAFLPTAEYGVGSMRGLLVIQGPGIKKGEVIFRRAGLTDLVPTICYMTNWPVPRDSEGAVLYQIFDDLNFKRKEIEDLRRENRMLRRAVDPKCTC